jgi:hypothetical protein
MREYTEAQQVLTNDKIAELEAEHKSDPETFRGTKGKNGGPWSGAGIQRSKRMLENLSTQPPSDNSQQAWRLGAMSRLGAIVNG